MSLTFIKQSPILFIKGAFKQDCKTLDQLIEEKYLGDDSVEDDVIKFDKPPKYFTTLENWPQSLNINCPTCNANCQTQDSPLYAIPKSFEKNGRIPLLGMIFNSKECAAKFIKTYLKNSEIYHNYLLKLHNKITKENRVVAIQPAGDHWEIESYGGDRKLKDWLMLQHANDKQFCKQVMEISKKSTSYVESESYHSRQEDLYSEDTGHY